MANRALGIISSILMIVGYFGPWIPHKTAALTVTGYELSEFAKFFPQVQGGTLPIFRALFLTPLLAAAVALSLLINGTSKRFWLRLISTALVILIALAAFPPYDYILASEYRLQLILFVGGLVAIPLAFMSHRLAWSIRRVLIALLALIGAAPALWQFALLRPLVVALYGTSIGLGWGVIICTLGSILLLFSNLFTRTRNPM